jgi:hypothetical protein
MIDAPEDPPAQPYESPVDPLFSPGIIPTLYAKIGSLTVRTELLSEENRQLREMLQQ